MLSTSLPSNNNKNPIPANISYEYETIRALIANLKEAKNPSDIDKDKLQDYQLKFAKLEQVIKSLQEEKDLQKILTVEKKLVEYLRPLLQQAVQSLAEFIQLFSDPSIQMTQSLEDLLKEVLAEFIQLFSDPSIQMKQSLEKLLKEAKKILDEFKISSAIICEKKLLDKINQINSKLKKFLNHQSEEQLQKKFATLSKRIEDQNTEAKVIYEEQANEMLMKLIDGITFLDTELAEAFSQKALFFPYFRLRQEIKEQYSANEALLVLTDNISKNIDDIKKKMNDQLAKNIKKTDAQEPKTVESETVENEPVENKTDNIDDKNLTPEQKLEKKLEEDIEREERNIERCSLISSWLKLGVSPQHAYAFGWYMPKKTINYRTYATGSTEATNFQGLQKGQTAARNQLRKDKKYYGTFNVGNKKQYLEALKKLLHRYKLQTRFYFDVYKNNNSYGDHKDDLTRTICSAIIDRSAESRKFKLTKFYQELIDKLKSKDIDFLAKSHLSQYKIDEYTIVFYADNKPFDFSHNKPKETKDMKPQNKTIILQKIGQELYAYLWDQSPDKPDQFVEKRLKIDLNLSEIDNFFPKDENLTKDSVPAKLTKKIVNEEGEEEEVEVDEKGNIITRPPYQDFRAYTESESPLLVKLVDLCLEQTVTNRDSYETLESLFTVGNSESTKIASGKSESTTSLAALSEIMLTHFNAISEESSQPIARKSTQKLLDQIQLFLLMEIHKDPIQGLSAFTLPAGQEPVTLDSIVKQCHPSVQGELVDCLSDVFSTINTTKLKRKDDIPHYDELLKQLSAYELTFPGLTDLYATIDHKQVRLNMGQMNDGFAENRVSWKDFCEFALSGGVDSDYTIPGCGRAFPAFYKGLPVNIKTTLLAEHEQLKQAGYIVVWSERMDAPVLMIRQGNEWIRAMIAFGVTREQYQRELYEQMTIHINENVKQTEFKFNEKLKTDETELDRNTEEAINYTLTNTLSFPVIDAVEETTENEQTVIATHTKETEAYWDWITFLLKSGPLTKNDICIYNQLNLNIEKIRISTSSDRVAIGANQPEAKVKAKTTAKNPDFPIPNFQYIVDQPISDGKETQDITRVSLLSSYSNKIDNPISTAQRSAKIFKCRLTSRNLKLLNDAYDHDHKWISNLPEEVNNFPAVGQEITPELDKIFNEMINEGEIVYEIQNTLSFANKKIYAILTTIVHYDAELKRTFIFKMSMPLTQKANADLPHCQQIKDWFYPIFQKLKAKTVMVNGKPENLLKLRFKKALAREKKKAEQREQLKRKSNPHKGQPHEKMLVSMQSYLLALTQFRSILPEALGKIKLKQTEDAKVDKTKDEYRKALNIFVDSLNLPTQLSNDFKDQQKTHVLDKKSFDPFEYLLKIINNEMQSLEPRLQELLAEFSKFSSKDIITPEDFLKACEKFPIFGVFTQSTSEFNSIGNVFEAELKKVRMENDSNPKREELTILETLQTMANIYFETAKKSLIPIFLEVARLIGELDILKDKDRQGSEEFMALQKQYETALDTFYHHKFFANENWAESIGIEPLPKPISGNTGLHLNYLSTASDLWNGLLKDNHNHNPHLIRLYEFFRALLKSIYLPESFLQKLQAFINARSKLANDLELTRSEGMQSIQEVVPSDSKGDANASIATSNHHATLFSQSTPMGNSAVTITPTATAASTVLNISTSDSKSTPVENVTKREANADSKSDAVSSELIELPTKKNPSKKLPKLATLAQLSSIGGRGAGGGNRPVNRQKLEQFALTGARRN